jgi:Exopolysaccharide synthesis, ExoD
MSRVAGASSSHRHRDSPNAGIGAAAGPCEDEQPLVPFDEILKGIESTHGSQIAFESVDCHPKGCAGTAWAASGGAGAVAVHLPQSAWSGGRALAAGETSLCGVELAHTHTSVLIEELVAQAPDGPVDLDWLLGHLAKRSFGLLLLLLGLLVIVPGVASIATLMVIFPSVEMMLAAAGPRSRNSFRSVRSISSGSNVSRK